MLNELFHLSEVVLIAFTGISLVQAFYKTVEMRVNPQPKIEGTVKSAIPQEETIIVPTVSSVNRVLITPNPAKTLKAIYSKANYLTLGITNILEECTGEGAPKISDYTKKQLIKICKGKITGYSRMNKSQLFTRAVAEGLLG